MSYRDYTQCTILRWLNLDSQKWLYEFEIEFEIQSLRKEKIYLSSTEIEEIILSMVNHHYLRMKYEEGHGSRTFRISEEGQRYLSILEILSE